MDADGQRGSTNPTALLQSLLSKREKLQEELRNIEKQVYELETSYLHDSSHFGHVLKVTSPAAEELGVGRDDGRSDFGPGRSKGGSFPTNGQGKPKKGRTASRDGKRIRPSSEQEFDEEDDPDLSLR